ncbi:DUF3097 family protein, partial [Nocardia wallacei]|uniref:DUF3097 family protein n=1 Tax=Nocardia wallacei TaxID=480035 RepID=UPI002457F226
TPAVGPGAPPGGGATPAGPAAPRGQDWKTGICRRLGWGTPKDGWRRVYNAVDSFRDLEAPLIGAVERLIDFVTDPGQEHAGNTTGRAMPR